ncbi:hypothetical protein EV368DRAFT_69046 [Lentinula lateritia]|nr:hypothetical protein EV368DRAFT_69046 [Lentinula lateritia]
MSSDQVVWSGYQLDIDSFKKFIMVLTGEGDRPPPDDDESSLDWAYEYTAWRFELSPRDRAKTPKIRYLELNPDAPDDITHLFFPVRWIPYKSPRQLDDPTHPDYATTHEPNEKDKAKLDRWLTYIHETNGGKYRFSADIPRMENFPAVGNPYRASDCPGSNASLPPASWLKSQAWANITRKEHELKCRQPLPATITGSRREVAIRTQMGKIQRRDSKLEREYEMVLNAKQGQTFAPTGTLKS